MKRLFTALIIMAFSAQLTAQWLGVPTPGIPRTPDGDPDLFAPLPRTAEGMPELTGLWRVTEVTGDLNDDSKVQPWARETMAVHERNYYRDGPMMQCMPGGPSYIAGGPAGGGSLRQIVQGPTSTAILFGDLTYRQIFTDGRELEDDPLPIWTGYSVGRWEGDTLIVETNGYNDKTWLHAWGLEHTDQLKVTERYTRRDFGHMALQVTYDDPGTFDVPLQTDIELVYAADDVILEIVCNEATEGGVKHWVGDKLTDARNSAVEVDADTLANYVGTYEGIWLEYLTTVVVTMEDGLLYLSRNGEPKEELIPQSENSFICASCTWSQPYVFNNEQGGKASFVQEVQVSGRWVFDRVE